MNPYFYNMDSQLSLFGFEEPAQPIKEEKISAPAQETTVEPAEKAAAEQENATEVQENIVSGEAQAAVENVDTKAVEAENIAPEITAETTEEIVENTEEENTPTVILEEETTILPEIVAEENIVPEQVPVEAEPEHTIISNIEETEAFDLFETDSVTEQEIADIEYKPTNSKPQPLNLDTPQNAHADNTVGKRGRKSFEEIDAEVDLIQVPKDEQLYKKQYYSISQVAKWFRVNNSLLRFWENEFDILKPRKNRKGDRLFRPEDIKNLELIYYLLRQKKYTIEGAKKYIKENRKNADMQLKLAQTLLEFKSFLLELKANAEL